MSYQPRLNELDTEGSISTKVESLLRQQAHTGHHRHDDAQGAQRSDPPISKTVVVQGVVYKVDRGTQAGMEGIQEEGHHLRTQFTMSIKPHGSCMPAMIEATKKSHMGRVP